MSGSPAPMISLIVSVGLDAADDARQHAEHAAFRAARDEPGRRRLRVEAPVARAFLRREHRRLSLEPEDAAVHVRLAEDDAGVVHEISRREIVRAVDDDVVGREDLERVLGRERGVVRRDADVRVDREQPVLRGIELRAADVRRPVQNLPLQVAEVHDVEIDDADRADAGCGEIHRDRRSQAAGADAEDLRGLELLLPQHADFRQDQMTAVALEIVLGELRKGRRRFRRRRAARDRRDDADRVARVDRRLLLLQVADVFVVDVDVDEAAQLAFSVVQMRLEAGVPADQIGQQLAHRFAIHFDRVLPVGERPQRGRNQNLSRH